MTATGGISSEGRSRVARMCTYAADGTDWEDGGIGAARYFGGESCRCGLIGEHLDGKDEKCMHGGAG